MRRLLPLILFLCPLGLLAQSSFTIPVQNQAGAAITGATVTLTCTDAVNGCHGLGPFSATSSGGNTTFTAIPAGNYTVTVSGVGINTYSYAYTVGSQPNGGTSNPSSLNSIIFVDGVTYKQSPDIGIGINAAYAALPVTGGTIVIPPGSFNFATPIVIGTQFKPARIECGGGAALTYTPTSGTAITFDYGDNDGFHNRAAGIFNCILNGPSSGTVTMLRLGNTPAGANGAEGFVMANTKMNCQNTSCTGVIWGSNTWGTMLRDDSIAAGVALNFPSGITNSGEDIELQHTFIYGVTGGYVGCVTLNSSFFIMLGGSIDDCQLVHIGSGTAVGAYLNGVHIENPGQRADSLANPALIFQAGDHTLSGVQILQDASSGVTKGQEISVTGGNLEIFGGKYTSLATIADLVTDSGTGVVTIDGVPASFTGSGFTAIGNVTSSGALDVSWINGTANSAVEWCWSSGCRRYDYPNLGPGNYQLAATVQNITQQDSLFIANQGSVCTNGELALSAGWQVTGSASVTAVAGLGQTCSWTITTGTTTSANPTITDTLTNALPAATTRCWMFLEYGPASTHTAAAGEGFAQTTLSATAPVFTFNGTPTAAGKTYLVVRTCGP
jgi:hypothetical protein